MADAPKAPETKAASGMTGKIVMAVGSIVVSVALALGIFTFFIAPKILAPATPVVDPKAGEGGNEDEGGALPATATEVHFEEPDIVTVIMEDPGSPASMLVYKVTLVCLNQDTKDVIEANKAHFRHLIIDLHSFRKREELINDRSVKEAIEAQIVKECNIQLTKLRKIPLQPAGGGGEHGGGGGEPRVIPDDVKLRVLQALHEQFVVQDTA